MKKIFILTLLVLVLMPVQARADLEEEEARLIGESFLASFGRGPVEEVRMEEPTLNPDFFMILQGLEEGGQGAQQEVSGQAYALEGPDIILYLDPTSGRVLGGDFYSIEAEFGPVTRPGWDPYSVKGLARWVLGPLEAQGLPDYFSKQVDIS